MSETTQLPAADRSDALRTAVAEVMPRVRAWLDELVRIPSVSDVDGAAPAVQTSARAVARMLGEAGFADVDIVEAGGRPAVLAHHPAPDGAPTVLLYAHHDVQPPGDDTDWDSPPFEPTERGDRLYGRGAADDKAGIAAHLAAYLAHGSRPPVGLTVFVEGEEESGSESLPDILRKYGDRLAADVMVIADSTNWDIGVPALTTSLRGLVNCIVEVRTLEHAVHSGMWGGVVPDALTTLARLLATLHDQRGDVAVEGLVSGPASDLTYPVERVRAESSLLDGVQLIGSGSVVERLWTRPAIAVTGIDAPASAHASNTLVPVARAKVSLRLAPDDDCHRALAALTRHLEQHAPWGARVSVGSSDLGQPYAIDARGPATTRPGRHSPRRGTAPHRSTSASAARSRSSPSSWRPSPPRPCWSPASRTPTPAPTVPTRGCTWRSSAECAWPRRCCSTGWPPDARTMAACPAETVG